MEKYIIPELEDELLRLHQEYHLPIFMRTLNEIKSLKETVNQQKIELVELRSEVQRLSLISKYE